MNKIITILLFFTSLYIGQSRNSNFEFSGVEKFLQIVKTLEANLEPSQNDWNDLFDTPGYKVLTNHEFTKEFFIDNFRLVFKPNLKKELESRLRSKKNIHHLNHYIKIRDNKRLIEEQSKKLKRVRFNKEAVARTLEYLPQFSVSNYPPVSFVIFESNGRGSSPIVVDLAATIEWDFIGFLSHEYHHWYRNRQLQINLNRISPNDKKIVDALSLIEAEGIADMVDKEDWYTKPSNSISGYARNYIQDVGKTPYVIQSMNAILEKISHSPNDAVKFGDKLFRTLPQRGHTTGYYIAQVILKNIPKKRMVKCVGNPFDFLLLYNESAKKSNGKFPSFSPKSISYINLLRSKYSK